MKVYYNENDPFAAAWLQELIADGFIPEGPVDTRSIVDVRAADLGGYTHCHFFAGVGGWAHALQLAGWPEDRPVWTGSCPCQPFSVAGQKKGTADERHLWPEFHRLVAKRRPPIVFGEQVASKDGRIWLAGVRTDLETLGYGVGAADLCAAGIGAPHIRQRLFWMAHAYGGVAGNGYLQSGRQHGQQPQDGSAGGLGDADDTRPQGRREYVGEHANQRSAWTASILIPCADGKFRRVPANEAGELEPALFPLAYGIPNRVGTLRGAGNAIVPQVAAEFIGAFMDCVF
ncbi:MAG: DNA cytosine methyltransferase [Patescibacteria group bacterium]|nr:DNA cytosine methyltransferase [Patescibacteria group bacterium]